MGAWQCWSGGIREGVGAVILGQGLSSVRGLHNPGVMANCTCVGHFNLQEKAQHNKKRATTSVCEKKECWDSAQDVRLEPVFLPLGYTPPHTINCTGRLVPSTPPRGEKYQSSG